MIIKKKKCIVFLVTLVLLMSCSDSGTDGDVAKARFSSFELANASDKNVYGFYQFGEHKGTVGVVAPATSASKGFAPFTHTQIAIISFKSKFDSDIPCAVGEVDVSKYYPVGNFEIIETVFTYKQEGYIELSFSVKRFGSKSPGSRENIVIGNIST